MKRRILFVDDEPGVLDGLRRMLRAYRCRWEMSFVRSATEALDQIAHAPFDVVVSDVMMPGKDGFEFLADLRDSEHTRDIPVVMLTAANDRGLKRRALDLGAADLLNKPIELEDLVARLQSVLRLKSHQDQLRNHNEILEHEVEQRTAELASSRIDIIWRLGKAAEFRDQETGNHVMRVGCYSRAVANALGLGRDFAETLFLASPLHDIGKIGIPVRILLKRGRLTPAEWEVMKQHCVIGAEILRQDPQSTTALQRWHRDSPSPRPMRSDNPFLKMAASIARTHHERWDGSGYPRGLVGKAIPLESRIVALADAYDALCSERPYKPACSEAEAREIVGSEVGQHFDPEVHAAFERSLAEFRSIQAELSDHVGACVAQEAAI
jgi:putative two-component system response regulator